MHIKEHSVPALIISLSIVQTQLTYNPSSNIKIVNFRQYSTRFMFCTYIAAGSKGKIENFFRAKKYWSKLKQKSRGFQIHPYFKPEKIWVIFKSTISDTNFKPNIFPGLISRSKFDPGKFFFSKRVKVWKYKKPNFWQLNTLLVYKASIFWLLCKILTHFTSHIWKLYKLSYHDLAIHL